MPSIEVTVQIKKDGQPLPGFPLTRRVEAPDVQTFEYEKQTDGVDTFEPANVGLEVGPAKVLIVQSERQVTLRLVGQSDKGIVLQAGGALIILGCSLAPESGDPLVSINNESTFTSRVRGVVAGT
jgi:hypothetical protein